MTPKQIYIKRGKWEIVKIAPSADTINFRDKGNRSTYIYHKWCSVRKSKRNFWFCPLETGFLVKFAGDYQ